MVKDISWKIQNIIEKRQPLAKRVEKVEAHLTSLQQYIQRLIKERNNFLPQLNDSQTLETLQGINLHQIEQEITNNLTTISKLKARFYRKTLNKGDNSKNCQGFLDDVPKTRMEFANCIIADCANQEETANVLEKILQYLTENITELDHKYALAFENKLIKLSKNLQAELEKASSALQQYAGDKRLFQKSFKQFWDKLTNTLQPYLEILELASDKTDETFQKEVNEVI